MPMSHTESKPIYTYINTPHTYTYMGIKCYERMPSHATRAGSMTNILIHLFVKGGKTNWRFLILYHSDFHHKHLNGFLIPTTTHAG
jgi:hypothetical protein